MSERAIRVLVLDDNPLDAELAIVALRKDGVDVDAAIVVDERELRARAVDFHPDVILCDYRMPAMDGIAAQRILNELYGETPVIFVTGTLSEELAVNALHSAAVDYVLKSKLIRLPSAVQRAIGNARERQHLQQALYDSHDRALYHAARLSSCGAFPATPRFAAKPFFRDVERGLAGVSAGTALSRLPGPNRGR